MGGYYLNTGAEGKVLLKEWGRGEGITYRVRPRGGYYLNTGTEGRVLLKEWGRGECITKDWDRGEGIP